LSTAFEESGIVEPYICQAIHTGEDTGNLGGAMTFCADMLDESNEELINVITKLIEPLILIGMGVVVGGVAISLFMPLFDMTSAIK
jgi:type II secretory pathway component PulF